MSSDPIMELSNVDTAALLPSSVTGDPEMVAVLAALDQIWQQFAATVGNLGLLATIDQQPEAVVDKLAYQVHVDYWDDSWPLATKRQVVKDSIRLHGIAGTRGAVEDVIDAVWAGGATVQEWWEYGGEPGTFQVIPTDSQTAAQVTQFIESIRKVKRATDHVAIVTNNDLGDSTVHADLIIHTYQSYRG